MRSPAPWYGLAAVFAFLVAMAGIDLNAERGRLESAARHELSTLAAVMADHIGAELRQVEGALFATRDDLPALLGPGADTDATRRQLRAVAHALPGLDAIAIIAPDGRVLASSSLAVTGRRIEQGQPLRTTPPPGGLGISPPFVSAQGSYALALTLATPDGPLVVAQLVTDSFQHLLHLVGLRGDMRAGLVDGQGRVFARYPDPEGLKGNDARSLRSPHFARHLESGQAVTVHDAPAEGALAERFVAIASIGKSGSAGAPALVAFATTDRAPVLAPWWRDVARRAARLALFLGLAVAALGVLERRRRRNERLEREIAATRESAERQFRESAERLRLAFEGAQLGSFHRDFASGRIELSPRALAFFGLLPHERMTHALWLDLLHPADRERAAAAVDRALGSGEDYRDEFRVQWGDGQVRWLQAMGRASITTEGGGHMEGVLIDVTARKSVEDALRASREEIDARRRQVELLNRQLESRAVDAESASRARDAFLRNMSHELRTPLNHILGGIELLLLDATGEEPREWLGIIQDSARHLLRLVDEILEVARAQSGQMKLAREDFSPASVMEEVRLMLSHRAEAKSLFLSVSVAADVPPRLVGDPVRLAQGLLNYLDNGIKFTAEGSVRLACRVLERDGEGVRLHFEVRDTGMGISHADRERLFRPFTQGDETLTRPHGGMGIGLALTREIAARMGGTAGFDSEPGRGSTFWFTARFAWPGNPLACPAEPATAPA